MSHGVHAVQHEAEHKIKHDSEHGGRRRRHEPARRPQQEGRAADRGDRAVPRVLGDARQERADRGAELQVEASNLWRFLPGQEHPPHADAGRGRGAEDRHGRRDGRGRDQGGDRQADRRTGTKTAARYRSEPEAAGGKGARHDGELARARARSQQKQRDTALAKYHHYEVASAAFQIGIVLASATVITGMVVLTYLAAGLGLVGLAFMAIGFFAPHAVHLVLSARV